MQECVEYQPFAHMRVFFRQRLLYFDHHVALPENIPGRRQHNGAGLFIFRIRETGAFAGALLGKNTVPVIDVGFCGVRRHAYPVFLMLDLRYRPDSHRFSSFSFVFQALLSKQIARH